MKMKTCKKCEKEFPAKIEIDGKMRNLKNRKYCLECSPFGKHNTKKIEEAEATERRCPCCGKVKPVSEFYARRGKEGASVYCKSCTNLQTIKRQQKFKKKCVEYKGGKCQKCGYDKCIEALEFHHRNPDEKDFSISQFKLTKLNDRVYKELDKCDLLCANCHREEHKRILEEKYLVQDSNLE